MATNQLYHVWVKKIMQLLPNECITSGLADDRSSGFDQRNPPLGPVFGERRFPSVRWV